MVSSRTNSTTTTCACDHMTFFAVLMDSGGEKVTRPAMISRRHLLLSMLTIRGGAGAEILVVTLC